MVRKKRSHRAATHSLREGAARRPILALSLAIGVFGAETHRPALESDLNCLASLAPSSNARPVFAKEEFYGRELSIT
jgi:hypothetical protein